MRSGRALWQEAMPRGTYVGVPLYALKAMHERWLMFEGQAAMRDRAGGGVLRIRSIGARSGR